MTNVILFGPPGVGKSTLIGVLKTMGIGAIDLEDLYPNRIRFQIPNLVSGKVIGAADLNPKRKYPNARKVLLYMDQEAYVKRRRERDESRPDKVSQTKHYMSDWLNADYDMVLDTTDISAEDSARMIAAFMKGRRGK